MFSLPTDPEKAILDLRGSLSNDEIQNAKHLARDHADFFLLVTASLYASVELGGSIKEDVEEAIRDWSKTLTDEEHERARELGFKYEEMTLQLAALNVRY